MSFKLKDENDRFYKWALTVSNNFPNSKFISIEIKINKTNIFNP